MELVSSNSETVARIAILIRRLNRRFLNFTLSLEILDFQQLINSILIQIEFTTTLEILSISYSLPIRFFSCLIQKSIYSIKSLSLEF